jgi:hypothetical protein
MARLGHRQPHAPQFLQQRLKNGSNPVQGPQPIFEIMRPVHPVERGFDKRRTSHIRLLNNFLANGSNPVTYTQVIRVIAKPTHADMRPFGKQRIPHLPQFLGQNLDIGYNPPSTSAPLSAGGLRTMNLIDVIASLNGDADAANAPDLSIDESFTFFAPLSEIGTIRDAVEGGSITAATSTNATWGLGVWGFQTWAA